MSKGNWKDKFPKENRHFETDNGILYQGDAIEIMSKFPKGSVDLVLTDPPYNISKKNNFNTLKGKSGNVKRQGVEFGEWDKEFDLFTWINTIPSLLGKNGSFLFFNTWRNIGEMAKYAEDKGLVSKDVFRWIKSNPMPRNRDRRYIVDYEYAVWMVKKGAKWVFNRQNDKYERPEFRGGLVSGKEKTKHPTQKSIALMKHLVKIHSNENDVILEPFAGSGTTLVTCENLNRRWIGIELSEDYCEIITKRFDVL